MEKKDNLYREAIAAKSEAVLTYVGKSLAEESDAEYERIVAEMHDVKMPEDLRMQIKGMTEADRQETGKKSSGRIVKKLSIAACVALAVFVGAGAILVTNVDAVRDKFRNFIMEEEPTHITLTPNSEENGLPEGVPATWEGFWYPSYLPEGFEFDFALEECEDLWTLAFVNGNGEKLYLSQHPADGAKVLLDNEADESGTVRIKSLYDGYWVKNDGETFLVWIQADKILEVWAFISIEEIQRVAESLRYY